ncbi:MAG TPA: L-aspartate oxidase [Gammaproteobacteria bacterium]|nr:L-aspartate oxidase [Gammaproteobacteria bacterium]
MKTRAAADVLVIGAGIAGASLALRLADAGRHVTVLAKDGLGESASAQALGGIAAAIAPDDSPQLHLEDTLAAGCGLSRESGVRAVVERAPACIDWLVAQGVEFDRADGEFDLAREAAHSRRRIVHVADATGRAVMAVLGRRLRSHAGITLLEEHTAVDLLTRAFDAAPGGRRCVGARVLDTGRGVLRSLRARHVVLATGGASGIYEISTNAARPAGDGIALAWRAGCSVADLEMVQFHPTALHHADAPGWLVTEAVRGEGGRLLLPDGERFMFRYDARGELAPRDIVARAICAEMAAHGLESVFLDISHAGPEFVKARFPNTYARCAELGIDITRAPMPVTPAAHYTCGGVVTGMNGETGVANLYAIGETASTGLHGANRLASNSLLEGLAFAATAAAAILAAGPRNETPVAAQLCDALQPVVSGPGPHVQSEARRLARAIRHTMSRHAGIVRSDCGLAEALETLLALARRSDLLYARHGPGGGLLELRNLACVAVLVARSALLRRESRGAHFNRDHPTCKPSAEQTILGPAPHAARRAGRAVA